MHNHKNYQGSECFLKVDNWEHGSYAYTTNTNKLASYTPNVGAPPRLYSYNGIGQMTQQFLYITQKNITYNASGLVTSMKDENNKLHVAFEYNERGKRAKKISYAVDGSFTTTWYVSDASGNELSIYDTKSTNATTPVQTEIPIYGASRIGICTKGYNTSSPYALLSTNMNYELKDYLGNVRATISSNKNADGTANVLSWADYLAFGEVMRASATLPGFNDRYGYQGDYAECDLETGWNSFDLRMYDPTIGRWLSRDPLGQYHSPYVGMGNDPINGVDPSGGRNQDWYENKKTSEG